MKEGIHPNYQKSIVKCACGETNPNYVPDTPVQPDEDPKVEEPAVEPELSLVDQIIKMITEFFAQIMAWFKNLFA